MRALASSRFARGELIALLAGVLVALAGAAILHGVDGAAASKRAQAPRGRVKSHLVPAGSAVPPRSAAGAVGAATRALVAIGQAVSASPARGRAMIAAVASGPLAARLERELPALARGLANRLHRAGASAFLAGWPLGYRVRSLSRNSASVAIWHLDVSASAALGLAGVQYRTTTYALRWTSAGWRVTAASSTAGPTPPTATAAVALDGFVRQAAAFSLYRDEP